MSADCLKRGKTDAARGEDDTKTRAIVDLTLKDIESRGDTAVRDLAVKFDKYDRESCRLGDAEICATDLLGQAEHGFNSPCVFGYQQSQSC